LLKFETQARLLFGSFPRRPNDALEHVKSASTMLDPRLRSECILHRLSLPDFLNKLAVPVHVRGRMLQTLLRSNVSTAEEFVHYAASNTDNMSIVAKLCGQHCISVALAERIVAVCNKDPAACEKFAPVSSSRTYEVIQGFFAASSACSNQPDDIEKIAYELSRVLSDARGMSRVSLFQLVSFLQEYDAIPEKALEAVQEKGVDGIPMFVAQHKLSSGLHIGAILLRFGLERHTELFERIGCASLEDLKNCDVTSIAKVNAVLTLVGRFSGYSYITDLFRLCPRLVCTGCSQENQNR
jgi:hypothetical protein